MRLKKHFAAISERFGVGCIMNFGTAIIVSCISVITETDGDLSKTACESSVTSLDKVEIELNSFAMMRIFQCNTTVVEARCSVRR